MADDLEDDYIVSEGESDVVDAVEAGQSSHAKREDQVLSKRKGAEAADATDEVTSEEAKRKKRKEKLKRKDKIKKQKRAAANLAVEPGAVARWPADMQADHMRKLMKSCKQFAKMTDIELDEVGLTEKMLSDTTSVAVERTEASLARYIEQGEDVLARTSSVSPLTRFPPPPAAPKASKLASSALTEVHSPGQPCILVITGNAQRAADLSRALRPLNPTGSTSEKNGKEATRKPLAKTASIAVAKLFARHFKIAEQAQFLASHVCPLAVGTPQRIEDLLEHGLQMERLRCIVLDVSWTDLKQRNLLDGIETRQALFSLLANPAVQQRLRVQAKIAGEAKDGPAKVLFF